MKNAVLVDWSLVQSAERAYKKRDICASSLLDLEALLHCFVFYDEVYYIPEVEILKSLGIPYRESSHEAHYGIKQHPRIFKHLFKSLQVTLPYRNIHKSTENVVTKIRFNRNKLIKVDNLSMFRDFGLSGQIQFSEVDVTENYYQGESRNEKQVLSFFPIFNNNLDFASLNYSEQYFILRTFAYLLHAHKFSIPYLTSNNNYLLVESVVDSFSKTASEIMKDVVDVVCDENVELTLDIKRLLSNKHFHYRLPPVLSLLFQKYPPKEFDFEYSLEGLRFDPNVTRTRRWTSEIELNSFYHNHDYADMKIDKLNQITSKLSSRNDQFIVHTGKALPEIVLTFFFDNERIKNQPPTGLVNTINQVNSSSLITFRALNQIAKNIELEYEVKQQVPDFSLSDDDIQILKALQ